jgi:hypothetical protein
MGQSYRDLLGTAWDELPPGVRLAFSPPLHAQGMMKIEKAQWGVAGLIAKLIPLPPAGEAVSVSLELAERDDEIIWTRHFGSFRAVSLQRLRGDKVYDLVGPFEIAETVVVKDGTIFMPQVGLRMWGVPLPKFAGPLVEGTVSAGPDDASWHVKVSISHVWFGTISTYAGVMTCRV